MRRNQKYKRRCALRCARAAERVLSGEVTPVVWKAVPTAEGRITQEQWELLKRAP